MIFKDGPVALEMKNWKITKALKAAPYPDVIRPASITSRVLHQKRCSQHQITAATLVSAPCGFTLEILNLEKMQHAMQKNWS